MPLLVNSTTKKDKPDSEHAYTHNGTKKLDEQFCLLMVKLRKRNQIVITWTYTQRSKARSTPLLANTKFKKNKTDSEDMDIHTVEQKLNQHLYLLIVTLRKNNRIVITWTYTQRNKRKINTFASYSNTKENTPDSKDMYKHTMEKARSTTFLAKNKATNNNKPVSKHAHTHNGSKKLDQHHCLLIVTLRKSNPIVITWTYT